LPARRLRGQTFDSLGLNPPNEITSDDRWTPLAVRSLLNGQAAEVRILLGHVGIDVDLVGVGRLGPVVPCWKIW